MEPIRSFGGGRGPPLHGGRGGDDDGADDEMDDVITVIEMILLRRRRRLRGALPAQGEGRPVARGANGLHALEALAAAAAADGADGADGADRADAAHAADAAAGAADVVPAAAARARHPVRAPLRRLAEVVGVAAAAGVLVVGEAAVRLRLLAPLLRPPLGAHPLRQPALLVPDGPQALQRGRHVGP